MKTLSALHKLLRRYRGAAAAGALIAAFIIADKYYCPFKRVFNIPCPGCGTGRAAAALLKGDFGGALEYNALVLALPGFLILYYICRRFMKAPLARALFIGAAAVFTVLNWLVLIARGI